MNVSLLTLSLWPWSDLLFI